MEDPNKDIASILSEIALYYTISNDTHRKKSFLTGAEIVENYNDEITSGDDIIMIKGIGTSIRDVINEYLTTGKVQRLEELRNKYNKQRDLFDYFKSFYGIGPVKSAELVKLGYTTLPQLWDAKDELLNSAQQLGIFWRNHINVRIPREEMNIINDEISSIFGDNLKWVMAGSYRRQEESSGDIDLLIERSDDVNMDYIYELLEDYIPAVLAKGEKKLAGIFRLSEEYYGHRIDILIVEPESWPFALLHFTGSGQFNVLMRSRAISFGWRLSEYSLYDVALKETYGNIDISEGIEIEKDIFDKLLVQYLEPIERTKKLTSLKFLKIH